MIEETPSRRAPLLPLAGLGVVLLAGIVAILVTQGVIVANRWLDHSLRVQVDIISLRKELVTYDAALRGYLLAGSAEQRADCTAAVGTIAKGLSALRTETVDNAPQQARLLRIAPLIAQRLAFGASLEAERDRVGLARMDLERQRPAGRALIQRIAGELDAMFAEEARLLHERQIRTQRLTGLLALALAGTVLVVVIVAFLMLDDARKRYRALRAVHAEARAAAVAREEAEAQLRQIQKMDSIGQLTGGIAHDFNNMLAVIVGSLDLAERRLGEPERLARCLAHARDGADRAAALVTRLLAFSRRQPLAPVSIDVNGLVTRLSELLERTLGEQVTVALELDPEVWSTFADPVQLENALVNLAVNARDAMPQGGRLTIRTRNATLDANYARRHPDVTAGDYVMLMVRDDGTGMAADVLAHAFDPFFTTKSVGKGTGLGLSQVFGFVKQSGGHVGIDSAPGQGTSIRLFLPRSDAHAAAPIARPAAISSAGRGERVLVVEDDARVRTFSIQALREIGYEPIPAEDAAAALAMVRAGEPIDLLFTDVVMPGMNGPELVANALALRPGLKALYTSGYAHERGEATGPLAEGAVLAKPFTIDQLARRVREAIDRQE